MLLVSAGENDALVVTGVIEVVSTSTPGTTIAGSVCRAQRSSDIINLQSVIAGQIRWPCSEMEHMVGYPASSYVCAELWFSSYLSWKRDGDGQNDVVSKKRRSVIPTTDAMNLDDYLSPIAPDRLARQAGAEMLLAQRPSVVRGQTHLRDSISRFKPTVRL